jgi:hypothetical protein
MRNTSYLRQQTKNHQVKTKDRFDYRKRKNSRQATDWEILTILTNKMSSPVETLIRKIIH